MQLKNLFTVALAGGGAAQSLIQALGAQNSSLSILNSLLASNPQLGAQLGNLTNVTLLAPSNDALSAVLNSTTYAARLSDPSFVNALLSYHVLTGTNYASAVTNSSQFIPTLLTNTSYTNVTGGQRVEARLVDGNVTFFSGLKQNSTVATPNLNFTGGVIHIVNRVLSIPGNISSTLINSNLTAAAGAITSLNLTSSLINQRNLTVFVPNNDAFGAIGSITSNLTTGQLNSILGYHVVPGRLGYSSSLANTTLTTLSGQNLTITVVNGSVFVNSALVTLPDLLTSNGVVHVINQVLNPSNTTVVTNPTSTAGPAFSGASSATGVPFTSGVPTPTTTFPAATSAGATTKASSSTSNPGVPMKTGAVGAAALFGGAAIFVNL